MEDTHGGSHGLGHLNMGTSLNPYYNGRYSWREKKSLRKKLRNVLILIIMEDTHGESRHISP